jgi:hypothetical protein
MIDFNHVFQLLEQFFQLHARAQALMRDLVILAERASDRASGEKNRPRAILAANRWLFTKMGAHIGHPGLVHFPTKTRLGRVTTFNSVDFAPAWTELTVFVGLD